MSKFPYKPRPPGSLKAAVSALVSACGGRAVAAEHLGLSQTQVQRYTDPAEPDIHMPLNRVLVLQRMAGVAPVTELMAAEMGGAVLWLPKGKPDALARDIAGVGETASRLFGDYGKALGDPRSPGRVDRREARRLMPIADEVMAAVAHLRADLYLRTEEEGDEQ